MDDEFAKEVLRLAQGQTIENYDIELRHQAHYLGIPTPAAKLDTDHNNRKPTSTSTFVSQTRRSISVESQASRSTGLTSNPSRTSKEHEALLFHTSRQDRRKSGTAVSIKDYDSILSHAKPNFRRLSLNFSPPVTPSPSTFSLDLSSRESSPRRHIIRSLSRLRLHRKSGSNSPVKIDDCSHCPHDASRHRRHLHVLPCGHRYCTAGLRKLIKIAIESSDNVAPACCGRPIPGCLVERVMSLDEQDSLLSKFAIRDHDSASDASFANATNSDLATSKKHKTGLCRPGQILTDALDTLGLQGARENLITALKFPDFARLREEQEGQRDRCVELERRAKSTLSEDRQTKHDDILSSYEQQREELTEKHMLNLSQVEDKHVRDEMDLRACQDTETRNTAIALRHMEAFCRGESASGEQHRRLISDQDRRELAKTIHRADQMDKKHEGEINVLRGEQARRMAQRIHRQELDVHQLENRQRRELEAVQDQYEGALLELKDEVQRMRERLHRWWQLQVEIWRKGLEQETGTVFDGALPLLEWPDDDDEEFPKARRDTLDDLPVLAGIHRGREAFSAKPPLPSMSKELGLSTTYQVRNSAVSQG